MSRALPSVLLLLMLAFPLVGQTLEKDCKLAPLPNLPNFHDFPEDELKGNVRTVRQFKVWNIKTDRRGKLIESKREEEKGEAMTFDRDGERIFAESREGGRFEYDCEGKNVVAKIFYDNKGVRGPYTTYKYDTLGRIVETSDYFADGILERSELYTLDPNGNVIKEVSKQQIHPEHFRPKRYDQYVTTSSTYKYDEEQRLIEEKGFYPDGKLADTFTYTYDNRNRRVRKFWTDSRGRPSTFIINIFDHRDLLVEKWEYQNHCSEGERQSDGEYVLCKGTLLTDVGVFYYGTKTIFTYDKYGNWIKQLILTITEKNGIKLFVPSGALYRQITYYAPQPKGKR